MDGRGTILATLDDLPSDGSGGGDGVPDADDRIDLGSQASGRGGAGGAAIGGGGGGGVASLGGGGGAGGTGTDAVAGSDVR